jgi:hypothetical protein
MAEIINFNESQKQKLDTIVQEIQISFNHYPQLFYNEARATLNLIINQLYNARELKKLRNLKKEIDELIISWKLIGVKSSSHQNPHLPNQSAEEIFNQKWSKLFKRIFNELDQCINEIPTNQTDKKIIPPLQLSQSSTNKKSHK